MPTRKRSYRFNCTELMVVLQEQSKRHSLGSDRVPTGCVRSASSLSLRLVWKRCHGHATAANAKNASTPSLDTGNIGFESPTGIGNSTRIVRVESGQTPFPQTVTSPNAKLPELFSLPSVTGPQKGRYFLLSSILLRRKMPMRISNTTSS